MSETPVLPIEHLRSWIGREETTFDIVSVDLVRKFNVTLDMSDEVPLVGDTAPQLIHYCLAQPAEPTARLGEDGHQQKGGFLPPIPLPRRMWASSRLEFRGDLHVGDEVRRVSRIADVMVKEGRSGSLCFVTLEHHLDVAGTPVIDEVQNIVYREATSPQIATDADRDPAPAGATQHAAQISATLLFRYSALTFNGHRIHYDRRYAIETEHYPGLVVHGPLQATLLLNFARHLKGTSPAKFAFRGMSPLFDDDQVDLHAVEDGDGMKLWTARRNGPIGMSAEASWS